MGLLFGQEKKIQQQYTGLYHCDLRVVFYLSFPVKLGQKLGVFEFAHSLMKKIRKYPLKKTKQRMKIITKQPENICLKIQTNSLKFFSNFKTFHHSARKDT